MENPENKSIISIGSSNLVKTEKLFSITQNKLSEIKPQYESVRIGNQEWMTRNLDLDRFRNGNLIPHLESEDEWKEAGENEQPAWCYYDNDSENGRKYGKLYNWFAVNDPRGLVLEGWHLPTDEEWTILLEHLGGKNNVSHKMKSVEGWEWIDDYGQIQDGYGDNSSGLNLLPGGCRASFGSFYDIRSNAFFWTCTEDGSFGAWYRYLDASDGNVYKNSFSKRNGFSVRCLRNY
ncbi:MAG: fibrobacter succinogenes major paralogous domain-containing protein [Bacteroidota bacterium]